MITAQSLLMTGDLLSAFPRKLNYMDAPQVAAPTDELVEWVGSMLSALAQHHPAAAFAGPSSRGC